ncbi:MAG: hypothetical protein IT577_23855 [Verrucomicrobiae bacterium]|nr:hypothetical protein [Verrucomicrobiae bacterium]
MGIERIYNQVLEERRRQAAELGYGAAHDDGLIIETFCDVIQEYAAWARSKARLKDAAATRERLIQVAALAIAAAESLDRRVSEEMWDAEGDR